MILFLLCFNDNNYMYSCLHAMLYIGLFCTGNVPVKPTLQDLLKELYSTASEWENIGVLLGIDSRTLDAIKATENSKSQSCLREMLKVWIKRVDPPPSWSAIAEAVELLGDEHLANQLRTK